MRIELSARFQADALALTEVQRAAVFEAMLGLPKLIARPHAHSGVGLRKIHSSGIWEVRVGLGARVVVAIEHGTAVLVRAGSHDEVRRFLRGL